MYAPGSGGFPEPFGEWVACDLQLSDLEKRSLRFLLKATTRYLYICAGFDYFFEVARAAGERTRDLSVPFISSFHHFTAEAQRLQRFDELIYICMYICTYVYVV
jgi:hypothetical protein